MIDQVILDKIFLTSLFSCILSIIFMSLVDSDKIHNTLIYCVALLFLLSGSIVVVSVYLKIWL